MIVFAAHKFLWLLLLVVLFPIIYAIKKSLHKHRVLRIEWNVRNWPFLHL